MKATRHGSAFWTASNCLCGKTFYHVYIKKRLWTEWRLFIPLPPLLCSHPVWSSCGFVSLLTRMSLLSKTLLILAHHTALYPDGWRCLGRIFRTVNVVYFTQIVLSLGGSWVQAQASATAAGSCVSSQGTVDDFVAGELSSCLTFKPCAERSILSKWKRKYSGWISHGDRGAKDSRRNWIPPF